MQQIEGVLPPLLTEELILAHLQSSGKQLGNIVMLTIQLFRQATNISWNHIFQEGVFVYVTKAILCG